MGAITFEIIFIIACLPRIAVANSRICPSFDKRWQ